MILRIENEARDYAWGSRTAIAELEGRAPSGHPEAEVWLGTHPGSPARVVGTGASLADEVAPLPFLLKILAAASPLSLQAHPTIAQAEEGFAREDAEGVPLDDPRRNYKDRLHKPELIFALSPTFDALCGFRPVPETLALLARLGDAGAPLADRLVDDSSLASAFTWLLAGQDGAAETVAAITARARELAAPSFGDDLGTVVALDDAYPGDPGTVISLLLNRVTLRRGEVLYLPAGNIHAYLDGLGVELMAASDNVLRGGLTPKHVDVPELTRVLDFRSLPVPYLPPQEVATGVEAFVPDVPDFLLLHVVADATVTLAADAIALCTAGSFTVAGEPLAPGQALYLGEIGAVEVAGDGDLFVATSGAMPL